MAMLAAVRPARLAAKAWTARAAGARGGFGVMIPVCGHYGGWMTTAMPLSFKSTSKGETKPNGCEASSTSADTSKFIGWNKSRRVAPV